MKIRRLVAAIAIAACAAALGGRASAQSVFGLDFLGESRMPGNARAHALGLSSFAVPDTVSALTLNAATMSGLTRLTFSMYEMLGISTIHSAGLSAHENRLELPAVMVGVPLRRGLVAGIGYETRFVGRGDATFEQPIPLSASAFETFQHRASLFSIPFSLSWAPVSRMSVAGQFRLERGSIRDNVSSVFHDDRFSTVSSQRLRDFSGTSGSFSALVQVIPRLYLGAEYATSVKYTVNETFTYTSAQFDSSAAFDLRLPAAYGGGAGFGVTERWWLTAFCWQRGKPGSTGFPQLAGSLESEWLVAVGVERRGLASGPFFRRVPIRLGYYEDRWHLEVPAGAPVRSRFLTLGTGWGLRGGPGSVDLSLEVGQIGSSADNGTDERSVRIGVGINASEAWSKRPREH
jgi:hypothetical protein